MRKPDLELNNLQWLLCHKTQPTNYPFVWLVLMVLFWVAIKRESVSLFLNHIHVFSCAISPVWYLKYPFNCFSFHFCLLFFVVFLFVLVLLLLLLAIVISFSLQFLMYSSRRCVKTSTQSSVLVSLLSSYFPDKYSRLWRSHWASVKVQ